MIFLLTYCRNIILARPYLAHYLDGFNLVPYRVKRGIQQRYTHTAGMGLAISLGVLIALAAHYSGLRTTHLHSLQRAKLERTLADLQPQRTLGIEYKKTVEAQEKRIQVAMSLAQQMGHLSHLLQALGEIKPVGIRLLDLHFQPDFSTIFGIARTQEALSDWVRHLKRIGPFPSISITQVRRLKPSTSPISPTPEAAPAYADPLPPTSLATELFSPTLSKTLHHRAHEFAFTVQLTSNMPPFYATTRHSL